MKKSIKKIGLITCVILLLMAYIMPVQAEEETTTDEFGDIPVIQLFIVTDGDFITIGDDDILGGLQAGIDNLGGQIILLNENLGKTQESADSAYGLAADAYVESLNNKGLLDEHAQTLVVHYDKLTDTIDKLWILRDEVVAFEGHYFGFVNDTNNTLGIYGDSIQFHDEELVLQEEDIELLQAKLKNLNGVIALVRNTLIGLGILACGLFLFNRRYRFGQIRRNGKDIYQNGGRQHSIVEFMPKPEQAKKAKNHASLRYKLTHIRIRRTMVKPNKTPVKYKTFHIRRNPEKSPVRFMFSFFHKL